ncbi:MAG: NAD-dependent epimerase/dehydratase [Chitinophagaceae bacterium]|nr:MAG: NAD-dependent epimerase/dehydratase [Chitinophagaceae bacterium]
MISKKALIFGVNGQDGHYLNQLLCQNGLEVIGISRHSGNVLGDVSDFDFVLKIVESTKPAYIFHLAATSTTNHKALFENHSSISTGTLNILEAVRLKSPYTKIFLAGSAMQFKNEGIPINENTQFESSSSYSAERIYSTYLARYYRQKFGLSIYIGFLFNHDSPLRGDNHINQLIVKTAVNIANGSSEKLIIGDFSVQKEFNYAGDIVSGIWKLVIQDDLFEVVIGSGTAHTIKTWIEYCFNKLGLNWIDHIEIDSRYVSEYKILISDPQKLKSIGWNPIKDIYQVADSMVEFALEKSIK